MDLSNYKHTILFIVFIMRLPVNFVLFIEKIVVGCRNIHKVRFILYVVCLKYVYLPILFATYFFFVLLCRYSFIKNTSKNHLNDKIIFLLSNIRENIILYY